MAFRKLKDEIVTPRDFQSTMGEPIVLKHHPDFGNVFVIDFGYDRKKNFKPIVILRFFEKNEIILESFKAWDNFGTALVQFLKSDATDENPISIQLEDKVTATLKFITDKKNMKRQVLALNCNNKNLYIYKESAEKLGLSIYDKITPKIAHLFAKHEHAKRKLFPPITAQEGERLEFGKKKKSSRILTQGEKVKRKLFSDVVTPDFENTDNPASPDPVAISSDSDTIL